MTSTSRINTFLTEYLERTRQFSRNANLYVLHVMGMDMIHGSFNVLFNLSEGTEGRSQLPMEPDEELTLVYLGASIGDGVP